MTKAEFRQAIVGKTKAEVVNLLGPPSSVEESSRDGLSDLWFYWPDKVAIYDPEAHTVMKSSARIDFTTDGFANSVGF